MLLLLTFSRSAWVAMAIFALVLAVHHRRFDRKLLLLITLVGVLSLALAAIPLRELIFTRAGRTSVSTETFSTAA